MKKLIIILALIPLYLFSDSKTQAPVTHDPIKTKGKTSVNTDVADIKSINEENLIRDKSKWSAGVLSGLAKNGSNFGYNILFSASHLTFENGFINTLSNRAFLEAYVGPSFINESTSASWGSHIRWEFDTNREKISIYGIGGIGGFISGNKDYTSSIYPRFAIGGSWKFYKRLALRTELSHENLSIGMNYFFYE